MPTSASPLELRFNLCNEFACLSHVTLAFECRGSMPMMPRLDAADANMRSLLASEFRDLESALQKTTRRVRALLEERLRSFLRCVECQAKVGNFEVEIFVEQKILGLQIAMGDAFKVAVVETFKQLLDVVARLWLREDA